MSIEMRHHVENVPHKPFCASGLLRERPAMDESYLQEREAFLFRAHDDIDHGLYEKAVMCARERLDRFPGDIDSWLVLAACHVRTGRPDEARDILETLDRIVPGWFQISECLGDVYRAKGMDDEALRYYRRSLVLDEGAAVRIAGKIAALESGTQDDSSRDEVPDLTAATLQTVTLADLYIGQRHLATAMDVLHNVLKQDPSNRDARERLRFVKALMSGNRDAYVLSELNRWLEKLPKLRTKSASENC